MRPALIGLKTIVLLGVALYAGPGLLLAFVADVSGWGAALLFGSICVISAAVVCWRHPLIGGFLMAGGGALGAAGFALSAIPCLGGCETYTVGDEFRIAVGIGMIPVAVGLSFATLGALRSLGRSRGE